MIVGVAILSGILNSSSNNVWYFNRNYKIRSRSDLKFQQKCREFKTMHSRAGGVGRCVVGSDPMVGGEGKGLIIRPQT